MSPFSEQEEGSRRVMVMTVLSGMELPYPLYRLQLRPYILDSERDVNLRTALSAGGGLCATSFTRHAASYPAPAAACTASVPPRSAGAAATPPKSSFPHRALLVRLSLLLDVVLPSLILLSVHLARPSVPPSNMNYLEQIYCVSNGC